MVGACGSSSSTRYNLWNRPAEYWSTVSGAGSNKSVTRSCGPNCAERLYGLGTWGKKIKSCSAFVC